MERLYEMRIYLVLMLIFGSVIPLAYFALYFLDNGFSLYHILTSIFPNPLASGFSVDVLLSIFVFLVWTFIEMRHERMKWLVLLLASCCIGLSASLPIYLLFKLNRKEEKLEMA